MANESGLPESTPTPDLEEIQREAAKNKAEVLLQAEREQVLREAQEEAARIVEQAKEEADRARVDAGLVPAETSSDNKVDDGSIGLVYSGPSDRFYVGADSQSRAVYAYAGGGPVFVTEDLKNKLMSLPHDAFEEFTD